MKSNKKTILYRIWFYLIIFSIVILGLLWLFQVIFIDSFYEWNKKNEIKETGSEVISLYNKYNNSEEEFTKELEFLGIKKGVCIEVSGKDSSLSYTSNMNKSCIFNHDELNKYKEEFTSSNKKSSLYRVVSFNNRKSLIYSIKLDENTYIYINTSIDPIDSTVTILTKQLVIVSIIIIILAVLISYVISNRLSKPISKLNNSAKEMAKGDYNVIFPNSDIQEINELSETLNYAKEELKKSDDLRKDLVANVSHDLKTPLTMIKAYAEMVRDITYKDDEKREKNLNVIIEEVDRLNILVGDILDLSRLQSNVSLLNKEEFDLIEITQSIINRFNIFSQKEGYVFEFNHEDQELIVNADRQKIEQVIYNLIGNAVNYAGKDKKVIISIINKDNVIRVNVKDNGKGIDEKDIKYIWDKYYKSDKNHQRNVIGTGLGLSIVKSILELHNFKYGIESKKNKGSTFYFEIINDKEKER